MPLVREAHRQVQPRTVPHHRYHRSGRHDHNRSEVGLMLVLKRNIGTSFVIGGNIKVYVLDVDRNQVKIGIEAPREINIRRTELKERSGNV